MSKTFAEFEAEQRRLGLLQGLLHSLQYRASAVLLRGYLASVGHGASASQVETDLAWLEEQRLVDLQHVDGVTLARLLVRGQDVATGLALVPGVHRPEPGAVGG